MVALAVPMETVPPKQDLKIGENVSEYEKCSPRIGESKLCIVKSFRKWKTSHKEMAIFFSIRNTRLGSYLALRSGIRCNLAMIAS